MGCFSGDSLKKSKIYIYLLMLTLLISSLPVFNPRAANCVEELDVITFENPSDILSIVPEISVRFENHEGNVAVFGYEIIGEEVIDETDTWIVESTISENDDGGGTFKIWISKSTGKAVQVEVEGETHTQSMIVTPIANMTFGFFRAMIYNSWEAWDYYALNEAPYGDVKIIGKSTETYGPTTLTVFKYKFTATQAAPEEYRYNAEVWVAPTQFGGITTYLYLDSFNETDKWFSWELQSITLSEEQEITSELPTSAEESESETETEEPGTNETEGEQPNEEQEDGKGGGIPGFPYESILIGTIAIVIIFYLYNKRI